MTGKVPNIAQLNPPEVMHSTLPEVHFSTWRSRLYADIEAINKDKSDAQKEAKTSGRKHLLFTCYQYVAKTIFILLFIF